MRLALQHGHTHPDIPVYTKVLLEDSVKFQYPPTSLLLLDIPRRMGLTHNQTVVTFHVLAWLSVAVIAVLTSSLLTRTQRAHSLDPPGVVPFRRPAVQLAVIGLLTLLYYPLLNSYALGQVQTFLTLLATLALCLHQAGRRALAGVCIGLICLSKPQLGLLLLWGLIRKQWSLVVAGCVTVAAVLVVSLALYGFANHFDYIAAASFMSRHGEAYHPNQSVNGLMHRLLFNGDNLNFSNGFAPYHPVVHAATLASSGLLIALGLLWGWRGRRGDDAETRRHGEGRW
jgi:hypothetical protein